MDASLWNVLHDGGIERIDGALPGEPTVHVSIEYLRNRFPGQGSGFVVHLRDCTQLAFQPYDGPETSDLPQIAALEPEILSAEAGDPLEICCVEGTLRARYGAANVFLDNGVPVALAELASAAEAYWREWSARGRAAVQADRADIAVSPYHGPVGRTAA